MSYFFQLLSSIGAHWDSRKKKKRNILGLKQECVLQYTPFYVYILNIVIVCLCSFIYHNMYIIQFNP